MNSFDYIENKIDEYNKFCGKKVILTTVACGVYSGGGIHNIENNILYIK
jgi:hypothetical protein